MKTTSGRKQEEVSRFPGVSLRNLRKNWRTSEVLLKNWETLC